MLGFNVYSTLEDINPSVDPFVINTINAHSYVIAKKDSEFSCALKASDVLLPDGFPIVLAARLLDGRKIKKIAGEDAFIYLLKYYNKAGGKLFFLGATENTLSKIKNRIRKEYPNFQIGIYSPPFKSEFSTSDNERMIEKINFHGPDILFVGMTAPKQEKWVYQNKKHIDAKIICSIGAVFDFYAGKIERPSKFWVRMNLEWFVRLFNEPRRLWKRYLIYSPQIFIDVFVGFLINKKER